MAVIKAGTYTFAENLVMPTSDITFTLPTGSAKYQLNDNNNYGTASSPDYVCGYIKVYSSVKTAKGQNYFFETGNGSVWNRYATSWYCYNDGDIYTATDDTKLRIVEIASDMAVDDIAYNWFNSNIQRTLRESVEQHITDAYTAIGNKSGTIPTQKNLANLAGAIGTISTGVDTSDGNIEPTTVLKGYKGYAKGVAVNGAIETYDGSYDDLPVADVVKGDLITIESKQYRVLNVNDTVAEVLAMYDASTSQQFNATSKTVVFTGGATGQQYQGSVPDTYLNETFFATLSATMQAAIVPKAINQDMWYYSGSVPSSGDYYHITYRSKNLYYFDNQNGTAYGTAKVGSRNVYALSVKDVIDYLGVSAGGDFADTDIWQMFWNDNSSHSSQYLWLRSASRNDSNNAFYVSGYNGNMNYDKYNNSFRARPAFQIDLSKIAYTKN